MKPNGPVFLSCVANAIGLVYLASFIMNGGFLWFFLRVAPLCGFIERGLVYVTCGRSVFARFLDFYFLYFSPLVWQIMRGNTARLFGDPDKLSDVEFWPVVVFFVLSYAVLFCCIFTLRKIVRGFIRHRHDKLGKIRAWVMLAVILLPALAGFSARLYLKPPKFFNRSITVDIWHGKFTAPRGILDDWSLMTPERLPVKPDDYASVLTRKWKWVPYLEFDFPDNVPLETLPGASAVHVNPHYERLDATGLQKERTRSVKLKLGKVTADTGEPAYAQKTHTEGPWEIHRAREGLYDYFPDIYLRRDGVGNIVRILECTPDNYCAEAKPFKWVNRFCAPDAPCGTCRKICTDRSLGSNDYDVVYSFDKQYLGRFEDIHDKIMSYVGGFYKPK